MHGIIAVKHFEQCKIRHLGLSKEKPHLIEKFDRLFPDKIKVADKARCVACHIQEKVRVPNLINVESITRSKLEQEDCRGCHQEKNLNFVAPFADEWQGCASCHRPGKEPIAKKGRVRWVKPK